MILACISRRLLAGTGLMRNKPDASTFRASCRPAMTRSSNTATFPQHRKHFMTFIRDTPTARKSLRFVSALLGSTAMIGLAVMSTAKADETWTGATSDDWFTASNWSPATVPAAAVDVTLDTQTPNLTNIAGSAASAGAVTIGQNVAGILNVQSGGSLTSGTITLGQNSGAEGAIEAATGGTIASSGSLVVGNLGTGTATFTDAVSQATFAGGVVVAHGLLLQSVRELDRGRRGFIPGRRNSAEIFRRHSVISLTWLMGIPAARTGVFR